MGRRIIAAEKLAPNAKGEIHSVRGTNMTKDHAKIGPYQSQGA